MKDLIISKELISEVLDIKLEDIDCWAKGFFENTEIEVIIKSCEFILTKRNQNENK